MFCHCKLCDYKCEEIYIEKHKLSPIHFTNLTVISDTLKKDNKLYFKYLLELNVQTEYEDETPKSKKVLIEEILDILSNQIVDETEPEIVISNEPHLKLIHELTQFTHGKTEQMLNIIAERYLLNTMNQTEHLIQIIITNKNLLETRQWKIRTKTRMNQYENIDVVILSSHPDSEYHNIDKFINNIFTAKTKGELPNVLIACFHKTRIENILKLLDTFNGTSFMVESVKVYFNISFDEPDANLGLCSSFLKHYKLYKSIIQNIEFITATPYDEFWKMLNENGIVKLLNPKHKGEGQVSESYEEHLENYMQIKNHNHIRCDYKSNNPLKYIEHVFENVRAIDDKSYPYIDMMDGIRKIIFSPAHTCIDAEDVGSHEEVVKFYTDKGFSVYLSNGRFKGFIEPTGERTHLDVFNKIHKIKGELRDSLRKWEEINHNDKAITGYWTIERGITFQTDGFNFTHMIISDYHKRLLNKLIQLIGRCNGNKRYISNKCNIICPQEIIDIVHSFVSKTMELRKENPENYNFTDFTDKNSCIPVKLTFVDDEYRLLCVEIDDKTIFHNILKEGYQTGKIILEDRNNIRVFTHDKKNKTNLF
jgi:hypothetical protein